MNDTEICEWPGCTNTLLCCTGNAGGAFVCSRHFKITNGKAADELLPHELEAMQTMADTARNREARVMPQQRALRTRRPKIYEHTRRYRTTQSANAGCVQ